MVFKMTKTQLRKKAEMEAMMPPEIGTVFTFFPKLPAELRIRVWHEVAMGTPRIIKPRLNRDVGLRGKGWSSATKVPGLLHTNIEARTEGLKFYELYFPLEQNGAIIAPARVYFNPLIDTLYLNMGAQETSRGPWTPDAKSLANVQHMAVQTDVWNYALDSGFRTSAPFDLDNFSAYQQLKTLTLARDFTAIREDRRHIPRGPVQLRQLLTNERKLLERIRDRFKEMAKEDKDAHDIREKAHDDAIKAGAVLPPFPELQYRVTPAVRVLAYEDGGVNYKNGAMRYDDKGKWKGYARGKFVRLSKNWEWVIPSPQWAVDDEGRISEDRKLSLDCVSGWKYDSEERDIRQS